MKIRCVRGSRMKKFYKLSKVNPLQFPPKYAMLKISNPKGKKDNGNVYDDDHTLHEKRRGGLRNCEKIR